MHVTVVEGEKIGFGWGGRVLVGQVRQRLEFAVVVVMVAPGMVMGIAFYSLTSRIKWCNVEFWVDKGWQGV